MNDPQAILMGELLASNEARKGQVPSDISKETRSKLEEMGFVIDEPSNYFMTRCKFPNGWTTRTSPDPRHITILDNTGKERITMFVKDTVYDQYAYLNIIE